MSITSPCVSIGIPVYNGEDFVGAAIESILNQTFQDFEIVISDNASTDRTEEICRAYAAKDARVRYFRNEKNLGAALNYDRTFTESRGKYFKWAAHDDLLAPTYLEKCIQVLETQSDVVMCTAETLLVDAEGDRLGYDVENDCLVDQFGNRYRPYDEPRDFAAPTPHERYKSHLFKTRWVFEIFGVYRREIFDRTSKHGAYYGSDKVLLAEACIMGRIVVLPEQLFLNRRHGAQSASLASIEERERWINPNFKRKSVLAPRLLCIKGYFMALFKAPIGTHERFLCFLVLLSWLLKLDNWERTIREGLRENLRLNLPQRSY
jgi:glycosyltransferase involved in cell wall biosynthesis